MKKSERTMKPSFQSLDRQEVQRQQQQSSDMTKSAYGELPSQHRSSNSQDSFVLKRTAIFERKSSNGSEPSTTTTNLLRAGSLNSNSKLK